jgi:hypothetical protein
LWVFSNPVYSWLSAVLGIGLLIGRDKIAGRRVKKKPVHSMPNPNADPH